MSGLLPSVEVWAPGDNSGEDGAAPIQCSLPDMNKGRYYHTVTAEGREALVCGNTQARERKCEHWTGSRWEMLDTRFSEIYRIQGAAWREKSTGLTYLVGGIISREGPNFHSEKTFIKNVETVSNHRCTS